MAADRTPAKRCCATNRVVSTGALMVMSALMACSQGGLQAAQAQASDTPQPLGKPVGLAINGFNYTDVYIPAFEVNGQGGGNIFVSSPTSGGGGTVCCVTWRLGTKLPKPIKIVWSRDRKRWCEKTVMLAGPVPANPTAIGVHFMPDGDVQVELTEGYPEVKVKLEAFDNGRRKQTGNVVYDEQTGSCKDGR